MPLTLLVLIILPTLFCNFSCPYCFELKKPGIMTIEVTDAIVAWVMRSFPKKRRLQVSWFGGEPLLAKGVISRLSDSLISVCRKWNAEYIAYMTTNGYYLDQEVIDNIPSWALRSVQVTLDGDRDHHDSLRRQRQGGGSFDCIAENIERFCEVPHECNLTIRVNCTDDNYSSTFKLLERFGSNVRRRARIFFRWVWPSEAAGYLDLAPIGRNIDPYRRLHALYRAANVSGWLTSNAATDFSDGYCEVDYPDHFNIDPFGNLYLCSHKFDAAEAVGSVFQAGFGLNEDKIDYYAKWYTTDPFSDIECCKCRLLPICWGGCRNVTHRGQTSLHKRKRSR